MCAWEVAQFFRLPPDYRKDHHPGWQWMETTLKPYYKIHFGQMLDGHVDCTDLSNRLDHPPDEVRHLGLDPAVISEIWECNQPMVEQIVGQVKDAIAQKMMEC